MAAQFEIVADKWLVTDSGKIVLALDKIVDIYRDQDGKEYRFIIRLMDDHRWTWTYDDEEDAMENMNLIIDTLRLTT